ncbi:hypothetical protein LPJ53_003996 [Coemansia erecta]|uniref:HMG box domain-containing protein n=1 Tax=Coemansia erecta TaxID=147472 RepID=A0A9W7Y034_9FUNG|nr:hypothetical protein LPJ53_003996 [Coemansia erecta]
MEHKVRQFYSAEGASFIEHVPGHCLVFIPNSTSVDYLLHELRRVRQPRRRNKQPKDKSNKPTNSFIKYRNHKIVELKRLHPEISQTEISRMAGECWRTEPEELKDAFRKLYQEEKRVYDMNKSKSTNTESEVGSDGEALSDTMSRSSVAPLTSDVHDPMASSSTNGLGFGLGLGLGLGVGADGNPIGFNAGRRRSHTLPPGGFTRSGTKRRISQEFRKHLANKKTTAYMNAKASNAGAPVAGMFADVMQTYPNPSQHMPSQYEFTFTPPQIETCASSSTMGSGSPYLSCETASPMTLPLNPNFPIADFTTTDSSAVAASQSMHQHTRSLTSIPAPLPIDTSVFAADTGFGSFVPNPASIAKSLADNSISVSLPMIDTTNLGVFSNDGMAISAFSTGYLSADPTPWPLSSAYSMMPDPSGTSQQQTQQFSQQQSHTL